MSEEEKNNIIKLFKDSIPNPSPVNNITGDGNIIGNSNTVIKVEKITHKTKVVIDPLDGIHITDEQAFILKKLVTEIVKIESQTKQKPSTFQKVWGAVNNHCRVGSHHLIKKADFEKARKYLYAWIGRISGTSTAQKKMPDDIRKRRISYIHTNMKKLNCEQRVRDYMHKKFQKVSLKELDFTELETVYRYVAGLK